MNETKTFSGLYEASIRLPDHNFVSKHEERHLHQVNKIDHLVRSAGRIKYWSRQDRHRWIIALFFGTAALYSGRMIMPISSIQIQNETNWNKQTMGNLLGSFFYGYLTTQFLGGYLSDLIGGERVMTMAAFGWGAMTIVTALLSHFIPDNNLLFVGYFCTRILTGVFQGFHYPSISSLMSHRVNPNQRQFAFSFLNSGSSFGTLACGLVGSLMMEQFGWRVPYIVVGLSGIVWTLLTRRWLMSRQQRIIQYQFEAKHVVQSVEREPIPWGIFLRHPSFWAMILAHVAHSNCGILLLIWLPTYFHDNFPDAKSWIFNVVPYVISIPSGLLGGVLGDFLMASNVSPTLIRKFHNTVVHLGSGVFLILLTFSTSYEFSLFCLAMCLSCVGFHTSGIMLNPSDLAPKFGGAIFGIMNMVAAVPGFLGVYITGYVLETTKSWNVIFNMTAILCLVSWVTYSIFGTAKKII